MRKLLLCFWTFPLALTGAAQAQREDSTDRAAGSSSAVVSTLAGKARTPGSADGAGEAARFTWPMGIAVTAAGMIYVTDAYAHTVRQVTPAGIVSTLAGVAGAKGSSDGQGPAARFNHPVGIAVAADGTLYVADADNHTIRKITPAGTVTTIAGQAGLKGSTDGPASLARFNCPHGIAVDLNGTIYIADTFNRTVRQLTAAGQITTIAGTAGANGTTDGMGPTARFNHPSGVAIDATGSLYVTDNGNHTVRKITATGAVTTLAGLARKKGSTDGAGSLARFDTPNGIAVDKNQVLYVADYISSTVRKILPTGEVSTLAGAARGWGSQDGAGADARFLFPFGVAVDASGTTIYVADSQGRTVRLIR